jgi:DNA-directed RNA polymerase alpha subunit
MMVKYPDPCPVTDLHVYVRTANCIRMKGYKTVGEVRTAIFTGEFRPGKVKGFGRESYRDILQALGIQLCPHCHQPIRKTGSQERLS